MRRGNLLKSQQHQKVSLSQIKSTTKDFYLPDECWESVFKFIINDAHNCFKSLSTVSIQFLSITNRLRFSITIRTNIHSFLPRLFHRFTNLTSLNLKYYRDDLNKLLEEISHFPLNFTSLDLSHQSTVPVDGLRAFSRKIKTLTSLTCLCFQSLQSRDLFLITVCFPNLQLLDLSHCRDISEEGIGHVLRRCCNIRHLNLNWCSTVKLCAINFEVPKLEVLDLSCTRVDDKALYKISKSCRGLLKLILDRCNEVTEKGVMHVVENCTQLRRINLCSCRRLNLNVVDSMIYARLSLRKIIVFP